MTSALQAGHVQISHTWLPSIDRRNSSPCLAHFFCRGLIVPPVFMPGLYQRYSRDDHTFRLVRAGNSEIPTLSV